MPPFTVVSLLDRPDLCDAVSDFLRDNDDQTIRLTRAMITEPPFEGCSHHTYLQLLTTPAATTRTSDSQAAHTDLMAHAVLHSLHEDDNQQALLLAAGVPSEAVKLDLSYVLVAAGARRQGWCTKLLAEVETVARRWKAAVVALKCDVELIPVYARAGYELLGQPFGKEGHRRVHMCLFTRP
jgi:predicted GNAT family N-acyltransferase